MTPVELRAARAKLGLSQIQLGAVLGLTHSMISLMESGNRDIQPVVALAIHLLVDPKLGRHVLRGVRSV